MTHQDDPPQNTTATVSPVLLVVAWLWVAVPFLYGLYELAMTSRKLFE